MFTKIAADLSGVQLTKGEIDIMDEVVSAPIVNHPKATPTEEIVGAGNSGDKQKKDCTVM